MPEQLILVLLFALIAFIQWVIKKSGEMRQKQKEKRRSLESEHEIYQRETPAAEAPARPQSPTTDSEAMRRLREALGLPDEAPEPVPVRRELRPPPLPETVRPAARAVVVEPPRVAAAMEKKSPASAQARAQRPSTPEPPRSRVRELLASPGGLRDAVVLSEILGRPKGAQI